LEKERKKIIDHRMDQVKKKMEEKGVNMFADEDEESDEE